MEISGKIQEETQKNRLFKVMGESVDNYLDTYLQEVLPKKTIVDYDRMQKLENLHESLKDLLVVNEDAFNEKVESVKAGFVKESAELKATVKALENKLNESMKKELSLNRKLDEAKARELVAEKTKDLPIVESKEMCLRLKGMGTAEIEKKFDEILEDVQMKIQDERNLGEEEKNLEEAITDIVEGRSSEKNDEKAVKDVEKVQNGDEEEEIDDEVEFSEPDDEEEDIGVVVSESVISKWIQSIKANSSQN